MTTLAGAIEAQVVTALAQGGAAITRARDSYGESVLIVRAQIERALAHHDTTAARARLALYEAALERLLDAEATRARPLVIVPCGGKKLDRPASAGELYTGSYHRATRRAAAALGPRRVLILSALHGLVELHRTIEPYDLRMGQAGSVTAEILRGQAEQLGEAGAGDVVVLAGRAYARPVLAVWPHAQDVLAGTAGIGDQLGRLKALESTGRAAA